MPTYDYVCAACGHAFEHFQEMSAKKLRTCPRCKKPKLERQVGTGAGLIFKGTGFYITDYRRSGQEGAPPSETKKAAEPTSGGAGATPPAAPAPAAPATPAKADPAKPAAKPSKGGSGK